MLLDGKVPQCPPLIFLTMESVYIMGMFLVLVYVEETSLEEKILYPKTIEIQNQLVVVCRG